jgi:hypothetical protein
MWDVHNLRQAGASLCVLPPAMAPQLGSLATTHCEIRGGIQKFPDWVDNEIYAYNNKHSLRSNAEGYDGKSH